MNAHLSITHISNQYTKISTDERIIGIVFVLAILLPHTSVLYLFNPIVLLYLANRYSNWKSISAIQIFMVIIIFFSLVWNTLYGVDISIKSTLRGFYVVELILFFPFARNIKIKNIYLYTVVIIILFSQLCYIYNIQSFITLFNIIYPYRGDIESESIDYLVEHSQIGRSLIELQSIRFGGLFHNSNQLMKYVSLCAVTFLAENAYKPIKIQLPFVALVIISALLAGSRTGFFIIFVSIILAFLVQKRRNVNIGFFIFSFVLLLILFYFISLVAFKELRIFNLLGGVEEGGSLSIKYANLSYYSQFINEARQFLVGNFSIESIKELYHTPFTKFDSEWGYAIYFYGFIFTLLYFIFLIRIALRLIRLNGVNVVPTLILLWIISSTILFSYRTSLAFLLVISKYYSASFYRENKK